MMSSADILMITHRRAAYTRMALPRLLDTCSDDARVWVWHNGNDRETLAAVRESLDHPRVRRFHHSRQNVGQNPAINWVCREGDAPYVAKVDDDCLVVDDWIDRLRSAHARMEALGAASCWAFPAEDFDAAIAAPKMHDLGDGVGLVSNCWVGGSGIMIKRACIDSMGPLRDDQGFTNWLIRAAGRGWMHGWVLPLVLIDHMDHPASPHCVLHSDADFRAAIPESARQLGIDTLAQWREQLRLSAHRVLSAPDDPRRYLGWRKKVRRVRERLRSEPLYI